MFHSVEDEMEKKIIDACKRLGLNASIEGEMHDTLILKEFEPLGFYYPENIDTSKLSLNGRRALWLNKEGPIKIRQNLRDRQREAAELRIQNATNKKIKAVEQEEAKVAKAKIDSDRAVYKNALTQAALEENNRVQGPPNIQLQFFGNPACTSNFPDSKWWGCSSCDLWFCHKKPCNQTMLSAHLIRCKASHMITSDL